MQRKIDHGSLDLLMTEQEGYLHDVHAVFKPMGSFRMSQLMGMEPQWDIRAFFMGFLRIFFQHFICRYGCQLSINPCIPRIKQICFCRRVFSMKFEEILFQVGDCAWKQIKCPDLVPFADNPGIRPCTVQVQLPNLH